MPSLTEAVREGRTRHFAYITDEGDPENDEPTVMEGDVMDVRLGRPDLQPRNLSSMYLRIPTHRHTVPDEELMRRPKAEASTSAGTDMEIGVGDRRVRFREEGDSSRQHLDISSDCESMAEPRVKMPRRAETSESIVPFQSSEASSSEHQQMSTAASDNPTGERLYMSVTEEGPSGGYILTVQRDRQGRWTQPKEKGVMNIQEAREERRSFYGGETMEHETFSIASAEANQMHG